MKKVLVATDKPFASAATEQIKKIITQAGYEFLLLEKYTDKKQLMEACSQADAVIIRSDIIDREVMEASPNLKIVVRAGAGYDNIDLAAATEKNIVAMNTPGQNSNAVAELAFGLMVYHARNFFNGTSGKELRAKKLGLLAYGNVGKYIAGIAKGFGMQIFAYDPFVSKDVIEADGLACIGTKEELFESCQYISLQIPANSDTKQSINYKLLKSMPKNAVLVNPARKEIICEESLLKIFAERDDFHYLSDVAPDCHAELSEKYPGRYFSTPKKMGAQTAEANINAGLAAARQIVAFFEKGDKTYQVNK